MLGGHRWPPIEIYKAYCAQLAPRLANLYRGCLVNDTLPSSMSKTHFILIHKSQKDPALCASYKPIALLNLDIKILIKLLTNRLNSILHMVIDSDQTGFISGKSTDINIHILFTYIHAPHSN